jgi:hypothetical protein
VRDGPAVAQYASRRPGIHFDKDEGCPNDRRDLEPHRRANLPRGTDLSLHSQAKLSAIARQLNFRRGRGNRERQPCVPARRTIGRIEIAIGPQA